MSENILNLEIFKWIDEKIVEEIILSVPEKVFKAWEILILEWNESNWEWYIIKSGRVKISIKWQKIAELYSGNIVWEIALLNEEKRTATVEALEDTTVLILNIENLINMINYDNNSINKKIIKRIEKNLEI